jgi:pimeloyl-ACP methyl ester carboxylesterase
MSMAHVSEISRMARLASTFLCLMTIFPACCKTSNPNEHSSQPAAVVRSENPLIVIGFMGGRVAAANHIHREAQVARDLQRRYPHAMHVELFANRDSSRALASVLALLDQDGDGRVTLSERETARIVIFGHSWGASETVTLARQLDQLHIPVLLTIQVDSVRKRKENDSVIPGNVREAINFYQSDGLLHGRKSISAFDDKRTTILGNFPSSYRNNPVSCDGYPWYARAFMHPHIEIENDPAVWDRIEALIGEKV